VVLASQENIPVTFSLPQIESTGLILNYKQAIGLSVFVSGQAEDGNEWTEEPNLLVLLGLEEFLSMVRSYKQVRLLITLVLSECAFLEWVVFAVPFHLEAMVLVNHKSVV